MMTPELKEWLTQLIQAFELLAEGGPNQVAEAQVMIENLKEELDSPINWESE